MNRLIAVPAIALVAGLGLAACGPVKGPVAAPTATQTTTPAVVTPAPTAHTATPQATVAPRPTTAPTVAAPAPSASATIALPEGPGALNPAATQQTIHSTICVPGWTDTVRPPESYTYEIKREQLAARGIYSVRGYQLDHIIALELGGAPWNPANLRAIPSAANQAKGERENRLRREVCDGEITLAQGRAADH